nr:SET and MYND domain-containing protein 4-like [Aedes albopictus]
MLHRSAYLACALTDEKKSREKVEAYWKAPITLYMHEALEKCPQLYTSDIFAFREYVRQHPPQAVYDRYKNQSGLEEFDPPKCNERAAKLRQTGNKWYGQKNYKEAMIKYNESICCACADSEDLGIGFANRSAVFYDLREYEFALENIRLARQNNYPARLSSKLEARELNCRMRIEAEGRDFRKALKVGLNVDANPSIPCLAKGVGIGEFPLYGRGMKAEQDFKVGDVILRESPAVVAIDTRYKFQACHHCASDNYLSLIPCPHCVSVMFCNEECLANGWKECHRFECGIKDKLSIVPFGTYSVGLTLMFYGLTHFNDSVDDMMNYCKENDRSGSDPFSLDYNNPLDIFKLYHTAKIKSLSPLLNALNRFVTAILYDIYLKHPLVRSLFVGENQRNFLLQAMDDYMIMAAKMNTGIRKPFTCELFPRASICNHSCDPNTHVVYRSGQIKIIVVRPINKGEQISLTSLERSEFGAQKDPVEFIEIEFPEWIEEAPPVRVPDRRLDEPEVASGGSISGGATAPAEPSEGSSSDTDSEDADDNDAIALPPQSIETLMMKTSQSVDWRLM